MTGTPAGDGSRPVVVVGAGPTGMTLANLLGYGGIPVLLVERNESTSDQPRAVSFDDESLRTFQSCGLELEAYELIVQGTGTKYFGADGRQLAYQRAPARPPLGHPVKNPFSQPEFELMLRRGLERFPHVDVRFSTELTAIAIDDDGTARITLTGADGGVAQIAAEFVVAADGGRSPVREQLGIAMIGTSLSDPWLVIDTLDDTHDERYAMHHCDPRRPYVIVAGREGRCRYEFRLLPDENPDELTSLESIARLLAPFRAISPEQLERCTVYTFHALVAERWRQGPVLLAGDAAHMMPPFAGQGLNSGIRDATNLAWKIAAVIRGQSHSSLLDTYETERRPHAEATVALSVRLGRVMMSRSRIFARARDGVLRAALRVPAVKRYVTGGRFRPTPWYREGAVVGAGDDARLVGRAFPQPNVLLSDGTARRLDDVLGSGFALVRVDPSAANVPPRLEGRLWASLAPELVTILLDDRAPRAGPPGEGTVVADIDGVLTDYLSAFRGKTLLLRPDRFVAAVLGEELGSGEEAIIRAFALTADVARPSQPKLFDGVASP